METETKELQPFTQNLKDYIPEEIDQSAPVIDFKPIETPYGKMFFELATGNDKRMQSLLTNVDQAIKNKVEPPSALALGEFDEDGMPKILTIKEVLDDSYNFILLEAGVKDLIRVFLQVGDDKTKYTNTFNLAGLKHKMAVSSTTWSIDRFPNFKVDHPKVMALAAKMDTLKETLFGVEVKQRRNI